jgi:hypothetical protein
MIPDVERLTVFPRPANPTTPQLEIIARRVTWWKSPTEALANPDDFLCRVMAFGLWSDAVYVVEMFGEDAFRQALRHASAGVFDPASWHYWHYRLGRGTVPDLPQRDLR